MRSVWNRIQVHSGQKRGPIKKIRALFWLSYTTFFLFDIFLEGRAETPKNVGGFFGRFEETKRTFWNQLTFKGQEAHWEVVQRILFLYAKLNPGQSYVQGMNEIIGPIYYVFASDPNNEWKGNAHREIWLKFFPHFQIQY